MAAAIDLSKLFVREYEKNDGTVLKFHQSEIGDVGCVVWDAALVLSKYLETADFSNGKALKSKVVIELGAGTAAVGLVAASLGANVTVTDLPEFVPLMQFNIDDNKAELTGSMKAMALTWGAEVDGGILPAPELVLLADCIYYDESLEPLVTTVQRLCGLDTRVLCCYEKRNTPHKLQLEQKFFELIHKKFNVEEIPQERQDPQFSSDDIYIFQFTLKKDVT